MIDDITNDIEMAKVMPRLFFSEVLHNITVLYRQDVSLFLLSIFRPLRDNKVIEVFSATRKNLQ